VRRLTLLRHAHAEDRHPSGKDFDRRLDAQGLEEAQRSVARLVAQAGVPMLIVASPAQRTRHTAELLRHAAQLPVEALQFDGRLYNASPVDLQAVLRAIDPAITHLVLVGHNPGISELCRLLMGAAPGGLATAQFHSVAFAATGWNEVTWQ
jgi:phosphohistidine phosphatase